MIWLCFLAVFPAFVLSKSVVSADITEIQVCQYFDARIQRFEEKVKEMKALVDVDSEFYRTLEASNLCDTVGRVAVPECVANHEGDECAAAKIESIKKPLLRAIKVEKSGKEFFDYCKYIGYKNVLKTFLKTRKLMSGECGLPGQKLSGDREPRNSLVLPLLVAGAYDPSSIWFQYFLCKDQQIYCYFFTQGWNQYEYGQYYLYENLLDDTNGIFGGSTDSSNLATLALLGGLGGGSHHGGYYPPPSGYSQVPAAQGRKRRQAEESRSEECKDGNCPEERRRRSDDDCPGGKNCPEERKGWSVDDCPVGKNCLEERRRRSVDCPGGKNCSEERERRSNDDCPGGKNCYEERKRRSNDDCPGGKNCPEERRRRSNDDCPGGKNCPERRRRSVNDCPGGKNCPEERRRRSNDDCPGGKNCLEERRRRSDDCPGGENCPDRKRRQACKDPDNEFCCEDGIWKCVE